jgi:hypothetical protein
MQQVKVQYKLNSVENSTENEGIIEIRKCKHLTNGVNSMQIHPINTLVLWL